MFVIYIRNAGLVVEMICHTRFEIQSDKPCDIELESGGGRDRPLERPDRYMVCLFFPYAVIVDIIVPDIAADALFKHASCRDIDIQPSVFPDIVACGQRNAQIMQSLSGVYEIAVASGPESGKKV